MTCGSILFTEADRALTLTHQLVTYPCLVPVSLSHCQTLWHMTSDVKQKKHVVFNKKMFNKKKVKKNFFYGFSLLFTI